MREKKEWFQKRKQIPENTEKEKGTHNTWRHNSSKPSTNADRGPPTKTLYIPATSRGELARKVLTTIQSRLD